MQAFPNNGFKSVISCQISHRNEILISDILSKKIHVV